MERVRKQIGVWEETEIERKKKAEKGDTGITVAVLDSGVAEHPDLYGKIICFRDFVNGKQRMYDDNGHGTHICGIINGSGFLSGGRKKGIAPQSRLVVGKVLDRKGDGMAEQMLSGLDWILENRQLLRIRVLNISVGIGNLSDTGKEFKLHQKIEAVWDAGIVVVCAAGNKGPKEDSISSICQSRKVITVGCYDGAYCADIPNRCETYSGRGKLDAQERKPDLVAPGTEILSCNAFYQRQQIQSAYIKKSGTSMATPIVSGAAALLLQQEPQLSNVAVKERLLYSAKDLGLPWNQQGWGMLNMKKLMENY